MTTTSDDDSTGESRPLSILELVERGWPPTPERVWETAFAEAPMRCPKHPKFNCGCEKRRIAKEWESWLLEQNRIAEALDLPYRLLEQLDDAEDPKAEAHARLRATIEDIRERGRSTADPLSPQEWIEWQQGPLLSAAVGLSWHMSPEDVDEEIVATMLYELDGCESASGKPLQETFRGYWLDRFKYSPGNPDPAAESPRPPAPTAAKKPLLAEGVGARLLQLSTIAREKVRWLWRPRVPLGKLTDLFGDAGLNKSTFLIDIAARVTRGRGMPDEPPGTLHEPRNVILLSAEDGVADTIRARFDEAGGDPERLYILESVLREVKDREGKITGVEGGLFSLEKDIEAAKAAAIKVNAVLLLIDPITAYLGERVNSYKDSDVRRVLAPLAAAAEEVGFAVIFLRHPSKTSKGMSQNPLHRGGGSVAFSAAARSGLMVVADPEDPRRRLLATYKHNLAIEPPTLAYSVESSRNDPDVPVLAWAEAADPRNAQQLLAEGDESVDEKTARGDARGFLREYLKDGPKPSEEVIEDGRKQGHSSKTLRRALSDIGETKKTGFEKGWVWSLKP